MRHTTGIVQDLDFRPREIIKRERIGGIAKIIAPGFEERLLARPFGGQMDGLPSFFWRARSDACRTSRTENSARMRDPGSANCSANAATSTTSCPKPQVFMLPIVYRFARNLYTSSELGPDFHFRGKRFTMLDDLAQYRKHLGLAA